LGSAGRAPGRAAESPGGNLGWPTREVNVTVAIPTRNGGRSFEQTLAAVGGQRVDEDVAVELLVCDSGSSDGTAALARRHGASVIEIAPEEFSHGGTRNLLMERAGGEYVAFLTQDAVPADARWLTCLLAGFGAAADVALVFGPYLPRPDASPMIRRELSQWFSSLAPDGSTRIDRLEPDEREVPTRSLLGPRSYFTDANGCVSRAAWREVPFRAIAYAEDHVLAHDMLRAGYAKAFVPDAAVIHSHDYSAAEWLRRSFDEARALHEIYGLQEQRELRRAVLNVWGLVGADLRYGRDAQAGPAIKLAAQSLAHHLPRAAGTVLGSRADRLPGSVVRRLSLERRG
jgi:glycosyltransferase involved in cell wall biosynthesis